MLLQYLLFCVLMAGKLLGYGLVFCTSYYNQMLGAYVN